MRARSCKEVKAVLPKDLDLATAQAWLADLRADQPLPALPPGQEAFTIRETAELLDIKTDSLAPQMIKRA